MFVDFQVIKYNFSSLLHWPFNGNLGLIKSSQILKKSVFNTVFFFLFWKHCTNIYFSRVIQAYPTLAYLLWKIVFISKLRHHEFFGRKSLCKYRVSLLLFIEYFWHLVVADFFPWDLFSFILKQFTTLSSISN